MKTVPLRQSILQACDFSCRRLYRKHDETLISVTHVTYSLPARLRHSSPSLLRLSFLGEVRVCWRPQLPFPQSLGWWARVGAGPRSVWRLPTRRWPHSPGCEGVRASGLPRKCFLPAFIFLGEGVLCDESKILLFSKTNPL